MGLRAMRKTYIYILFESLFWDHNHLYIYININKLVYNPNQYYQSVKKEKSKPEL